MHGKGETCCKHANMGVAMMLPVPNYFGHLLCQLQLLIITRGQSNLTKGRMALQQLCNCKHLQRENVSFKRYQLYSTGSGTSLMLWLCNSTTMGIR